MALGDLIANENPLVLETLPPLVGVLLAGGQIRWRRVAALDRFVDGLAEPPGSAEHTA